MGIKFNADEAFEMAEKIERNGGIFYRKAAEINAEGKELLLTIAEQEDLHLKLFQDMRADLAASDADATAFDPYNEAAMYLQAMANGHVFDLNASILKGGESLDEIIEIAIRAEKDSIAFFVGLKELVSETMGRGKMDDLILEEMKHIRWLTDRKMS